MPCHHHEGVDALQRGDVREGLVGDLVADTIRDRAGLLCRDGVEEGRVPLREVVGERLEQLRAGVVVLGERVYDDFPCDTLR